MELEYFLVPEAAKAAHEAVRAYNAAIGDPAIPSWDDTPAYMRQAALEGAGALVAHPEWGPEENHTWWLRSRLEQGWSHGPIKDPEIRQHPCLVPWDQLPATQRLKNVVFVAIVRGLVGQPRENIMGVPTTG